jgi:hypothetical protein
MSGAHIKKFSRVNDLRFWGRRLLGSGVQGWEEDEESEERVAARLQAGYHAGVLYTD